MARLGRRKRGSDFPRWHLLWRVAFTTEDWLGTLPMVIVTPTFAALAATVWAVSTPSRVVLQGRAVSVPPSLGESVLTAVIGGFVGICVVIVGAFVIAWASYRLFGSRVWSAEHATVGSAGAVYPSFLWFELWCEGSFPIAPTTLGAVGCYVDTGADAVDETSGGRMALRANPEGLIAYSMVKAEPGEYEVRWYANEGKRKLHEIARAKVRVAADETLVQLPLGWQRITERDRRLYSGGRWSTLGPV